jgi:hypothetical protein
MSTEQGRAPRGARFGVGWFALVIAVATASAGGALLTACGSDPEAGAPPEAGAGDEVTITPPAETDGQAPPPSDAGADVTCLDADPDADVDCTGKCGPVTDPCTGKTKSCGGCPAAPDGGAAQVCDLLTNTCGEPKVTCADLGAECGTVKNSCGEYLDCPDTSPKGCADGKECDPDTHKCKDCQNVTCQDLGYQCGFAWLGCGTDTPANYTDCGSCAPDPDGGAPRKCNGVFHTCEPSCTPKSAAELCAEAKTKRGVECGIITNGCGGTVSCDSVPGFGCAGGESCGVRGIANRCDKKQEPDECKALGKNCGDITSACTGQKIHCGDCAAGEVCNANGVCGKPCAAKTCADFSAFECGTFDDGCGSTIKCGSCPSGICDDATNTCCAANTCAATYAGKCGTALPNGCGTNSLNCPCAGGTCTTDGGASPAPPASTPGMCCTPFGASHYTGAGQCGTNLPNGCGVNNVNASCPSGQDCVNNATGSPGPMPPAGTVGTCCVRTDTGTCSGTAAGTCPTLTESCRLTSYTCNKCTSGTICSGGTCCTGAPACSGGGGENAECNVTKTPVDPGCGSDRSCNCAGGRTCWCTDHVCTAADPAGVCKAPLTCSKNYPGQCGTKLSNGVGGTINCGCGTGKVCSSTTPGVPGTCECNNPTGAPYTCTNVPGGPGTPGGDACGTYNNGCGGTLVCNCPTPGQVCNTAPNPNVCCAPATCPAVPGIGTACGAVTNGCTTVSCACPSGAGNENFQCTAGVCACVKDTCRGRTGAQPDRCGGTLDCGG